MKCLQIKQIVIGSVNNVDCHKKVFDVQSSWKKIRNIVHWSPFIQQFKRRRYPWIQLAGHQGNFQAGDAGGILKKYDAKEHRSFNKLMKDVLRPYVPEYRGETAKDGDCYLQLQDLLCEFEAPCVMDIKMGCRTYLEEELVKAREKPTLRQDMYQKMVEVDPNAPTEEEHKLKGITKSRYLQWRDDMSSTTDLGFRIEGIRKSDGAQVKNFKKTKNKSSVKDCLKLFVEGNPTVIHNYLRRLKAIRATQEVSPFFKSHEIIGSSLLFVHDKTGQANAWMIDFGKTAALPQNVAVTHRAKWVEGNCEDGYLMGIDSLIDIFEELYTEFSDAAGRVGGVGVVDSKTDTGTTTCDTGVRNSSQGTRVGEDGTSVDGSIDPAVNRNVVNETELKASSSADSKRESAISGTNMAKDSESDNTNITFKINTDRSVRADNRVIDLKTGELSGERTHPPLEQKNSSNV